MSNPVSLTVNATEISTTTSTQSGPDSGGIAAPEAMFAGLLQDKVAELEMPFELLTLGTDPLEHSAWQLMPDEVTEYGNSFPENNVTQTTLLVAWQDVEPIPLSPVLQPDNGTLTTRQVLQLDTDTETVLISNKTIITPAMVSQQQTGNMDNMIKAFLAIQSEPVTVEPQFTVTNVDIDQPTINTMPSTLSANTSTQVRPDVQLQPITIPPTRPEWSNVMGDRLQWMANNKIQAAEIRLDPPELGSVEIKIVIHKDTAQVNFVSPHAQVRDAVENAIPRLREMFEEMGLSLGDVNVSQESFKQQTNDGSESNTNSSQSTISEELVADDSNLDSQFNGGETVSKGSGLLDTYV
jgi:flagellar hook-length control protein FliK